LLVAPFGRLKRSFAEPGWNVSNCLCHSRYSSNSRFQNSFRFHSNAPTPLEHAPSNFVPSRNHRPANIRFAPASELKAGVFEFDASPVCRAKAESFSTKLALRASLLTRFYFTCSVAELIDVPRADYHSDFWEDFVTGSTYRGDVASELTAHIVLKLNK
jgi:hypothetical protein